MSSFAIMEKRIDPDAEAEAADGEIALFSVAKAVSASPNIE